MNQQNQTNNSLQTLLSIAAILMLGYLIHQMSSDSASSYRAVVEPAPDTAVIAAPLAEPVEVQPGLVIIEEPAVIIATGAPPSVPVVAPVPTAVPTAEPTHPPLPGSMQEAYEMGYWAMPITPAQYQECVADPSANPACQFYVGGER